jgi:hypothetical protein
MMHVEAFLLLLALLSPQEKVAPPASMKVAALNLIKNGDFEKGDEKNGPLGWEKMDGLCVQWIQCDSGSSIRSDPSTSSESSIRSGHGMVMRLDTNVLATEYRKRLEEMKLEDPPPARQKTPPHPERDKYKTVAAHEGVGFLSDPILVQQGQRYRLKVDVRAEAPPMAHWKPKVFVIGYFEHKDKERRGYKAHKSLEMDKTWRTFTFDFDPTKRTPQVTHIRIKLYAYWPPGIYFFDNVSLEPAPPRDAPSQEDG